MRFELGSSENKANASTTRPQLIPIFTYLPMNHWFGTVVTLQVVNGATGVLFCTGVFILFAASKLDVQNTDR